MIEPNDWRITNQANYLTGAVFEKRIWHTKQPHWDHNHCAFCAQKFSERPVDLREGYCTLDGEHWVCPTCFEDFEDIFGFRVERQFSIADEETAAKLQKIIFICIAFKASDWSILHFQENLDTIVLPDQSVRKLYPFLNNRLNDLEEIIYCEREANQRAKAVFVADSIIAGVERELERLGLA
jgi:hypothetical protein